MGKNIANITSIKKEVFYEKMETHVVVGGDN